MATATKSVSSFGRIRIIVDQLGQNQSENRTRFRVRFVLLNDAQNRAFNNNNIAKSISGSGSWSGSGPFNVPARGSQTIIDREFVVNHNSAGNLTVTFTGTLGSTGTSTFGSGGSVSVSLTATRIPKRPGPPGAPVFSNVQPTSLTVTFDASSTTNGSAITGYQLRRWNRSSRSGNPNWTQTATGRTRNLTGLTPGTTYTFDVRARNGSADNNGYSNPSAARSRQMLAGAWVRSGGSWKLAVPYVRSGGSWKMARPYVRHSGSWKATN